MTSTNDLTFRVYGLATKPFRVWAHRSLQRKAQVPVTGIFLHRIADDYPNDWSMTNATFDSLIDWLERNVDLVSLDDAQQLLRTGNRGRLAVNITFDDGYADNCSHAIPTLLKKKIPFTYFVTTENIRTGESYPHDVLNNQPLAPNTIDEIKAMANAGVEIGVHTRTHPDIGKIDRLEELESEIGGARQDIANWLGRTPNHFAFPFGLKSNITPMAVQYLYDEGYHSYSSAFGGYNFPYDGAFHFKRFHADPNLARMKNWLSFDPRWIYTKPEFDYIPSGDKRRQNRTDNLVLN